MRRFYDWLLEANSVEELEQEIAFLYQPLSTWLLERLAGDICSSQSRA
jgi:hypothetical protein